MAKQPYEVLLRFDANGKISGGHAVMAEYIDGKAYPDIPESIEGLKANTTLALTVKDYCAASLLLAEADIKSRDDIEGAKDTRIDELEAKNAALTAIVEDFANG